MEADQVSSENHSNNNKNVHPGINRNLVFYAQILIIVIVVVASIVNLSLNSTQHTELWVAVLSTSLGAVLPSPKLKHTKRSKSQESLSNSETLF